VDELHGQVVGDPAFWPAYEELNRRNAVVFYHPARASCCRKLPGQSGSWSTTSNTARAIDSLLWNGTLSKFPNVRHIFSHSGGAFTGARRPHHGRFSENRADKVPNGVEYEIKETLFRYCARKQGARSDALKDIVPVSQIMYGSDVPLRNYDLTDPGLDVIPGFRRATGGPSIEATPSDYFQG